MHYHVYAITQGRRTYLVSVKAQNENEALQVAHQATGLPQELFPFEAEAQKVRKPLTPEQIADRYAILGILSLFWVSGCLGAAEHQPEGLTLAQVLWTLPGLIGSVISARFLRRLNKERPNEEAA